MLALYKNIKARRLELKMSQDRLAELTGYKDRSSIEKGEVDLAESKIREFAKALKITPQELMGWDDPDTDISIDETFERICEFYNILNPEGKAEALKRISELSQILQYSANHKAVAIPMAIPYDTLLAAARNDHADDPDETEKMQTDMNLLKRPKKKDDAN
mgnify:FL=1